MTTIDSKKRDRKGAQLALEMEPALMERLRAYSAADGRSISTLVRRWIELGLDGKTDLTESQIPRTEFTDLVDIVTLMRDEVAELAKWRQAQNSLLPKEPDTAFAMDINLHPMAELATRWGITANTVSRRLAFLGIKPERRGNLRYIEAGELALGDALQAHIASGKPMELFMPALQQAKNHILQTSEGISKRKEWKTCAFYLQPKTFEKLQRYVLELKLEGKNGDQSDVVDSALQMWMDDGI